MHGDFAIHWHFMVSKLIMEKLEKILYNIAKEDLTVAKYLYKKRKYSQSLFYFQQSVEKANKSFALINGIIQPKELLSKVGHDTLNIYRKSIDSRTKEIEESILSISKFPQAKEHEYFNTIKDYQKELITGQQFLKNIKNKDLTKLPVMDLHYILDQLEDMSKTKVPAFSSDMVVELDKSFKTYLDFMGSFGSEKALQEKAELEKELENPINKEKIIELIKLMLQTVIDAGFINYTLYFCAIITMPHVSKTRYPFMDSKSNPLKIYNRNHPLVKLQPHFMQLMRKALKKMPLTFDDLKMSAN